MSYLYCVLLNNLTLVKITGNVVRRRISQFHLTLLDLFMRVCALE